MIKGYYKNSSHLPASYLSRNKKAEAGNKPWHYYFLAYVLNALLAPVIYSIEYESFVFSTFAIKISIFLRKGLFI